MRTLFLIICWGSAHIGFGQSVTPAVIGSLGVKGMAGHVAVELSLGESFTSTISHQFIITQGMLQPFAEAMQGPLPVLGLQLEAKRKNAQHVQLDWKTIQEINNKGYTIERQKEGEAGFQPLRFVPTKAGDGNSSLPLSYQQLDTNAFAGKTWYRLKQEDRDGKFSYSVIRMVSGAAAKEIVLKAWPVPAVKDFSVSVSGIQKDQLLLFDAYGRQVRQQSITGNEIITFTGLVSGTYFLRLKNQSEVQEKVVVQGGY